MGECKADHAALPFRSVPQNSTLATLTGQLRISSKNLFEKLRSAGLATGSRFAMENDTELTNAFDVQRSMLNVER